MSEVIETDEVLSVRRFTADMLDEWLLGRLDNMWPGHNEAYWRNRIADLSRANSFLFITNGEAVLCAMKVMHPMTANYLVHEVFAWARSARLSYDQSGDWTIPGGIDRPLVQLYQYAREWMRSMNGFRYIVGTCSDMTPSKLKNYMKSNSILDVR